MSMLDSDDVPNWRDRDVYGSADPSAAGSELITLAAERADEQDPDRTRE
jgi:hypothetical protein